MMPASVTPGWLLRWSIPFLLALPFVGTVWAISPVVTAGKSHTCALDSSGGLGCWGDDHFGQLGRGRVLISTIPRQVVGGSMMAPERVGQAMIAGGESHTIVVKSDGSLWSWGSNYYSQLGDGTATDSSIPKQIGTGFSSVSAGEKHTVAIKSDGSLWAWGQNVDGKLGDGTQTASLIPKQIGTGFSSVSTGENHTVAIKSDGSLWAWGFNGSGQLGDGTLTGSLAPKQIGTGFSSVAAGSLHSVAVKKDGTLWAWGFNGSGQLGDGTKTDRLAPKWIGAGFASVATGWMHTLALKSDGSLWAWGANHTGQLGDGTSDKFVHWTPKQIGTGFSQVAAGRLHTVALQGDTLWAWGYNASGQLGDGTTTDRAGPKKIGTGFSSVVAGARHTIAIKSDGTLWAWGDDGAGQIGGGATTSNYATTKQIGIGYSSVAAGEKHTIAVKSDGTLWVWGDNSYGQFGDFSYTSSSIPKKVGIGFSSVAAGSLHSVAVKKDGTLWAWGDNSSGQLGDGTRTFSGDPKQIGTGFTSFTAGFIHTLALKSDGSLWAWGDNRFGQLGDGTQTASLIPKQIGTQFSSVSAGRAHTAAVKSDGSLWAWGNNSWGQLGDGTQTHSLAPKQIGTGFSSVATGGVHTVALKSDGSLWAWGDNQYHQLGDGTQTASLIPKQIGTGFSSVAAGLAHSVAVRPEGTVWVWGYNSSGQLGNGTFVSIGSVPNLASNESSSGPLDLSPGVPNNIPPELIPPYWLQVTKATNVSTALTYNPEDLNKSGSVYVVAYLPSNSPLLGGASTTTGLSVSSPFTKDTGCPVNTTGTVPAVLTRSGWKQTDCTTPTLPLYTGILDMSNNTFGMYEASKFDQTKDNGLFCVGYVGASTSSAKGLIRSVVSGVDANLSNCPPIQIGSGTGGTADTTAPSVPLNITATATGPGQVNLSWNAATDAVGVTRYNIYRGGALIATLDNVTTFTDSSPQASNGYSYSVTACDAAANCSGQSTPAIVFTSAQPNVTLGVGWNLVGNGGNTAMNVPSLFGDANKVLSVWKWVKTGSTTNIRYPAWAFYSPLQSDGGVAYAASNGFDAFTSIASGEGFWVNAKTAFSVPMTAPAWILSSVFAPNQSKALTPGWSLIATGEAQTASAFNKAIGSAPPSPGTIPINMTSLWAWQNSAQRWYFYAPSLEANAGLSAYLDEMNYMDLGSVSFAPTMGFWVNRP